MARTTGPVCRLCRREGMKLFLKGTRCDTPKCAIERRESPPGMHLRRGKLTDYGIHLREKQKVKHYYGVLERQFRGYYRRAVKGQGQHRRNVDELARTPAGQCRASSRLWLVAISSPPVDQPRSHYGEWPSLRYSQLFGASRRCHSREESSEEFAGRAGALTESHRDTPDFLSRVDGAIPEGRVNRLPTSEDVSLGGMQRNLIVELCSK